MLPYITPERYNAMGFGATAQDDATLLSLIHRASLAVDRYVAAPIVPTRFSFRGGTVTDEEHSFYLGNEVNEHPTRIIWPNCTPLKSVISCVVWVTKTQSISFDVDELFLTKENFHILSVGLTSASMFGAVAVPVLGLTNPIVKIAYTYGNDFDAVDEMLAPDSTYTVYRAVNQFWNDDTPVIKKNGSVISTGFTIDKTEGKVTFAPALSSTDVVEASYGYDLLPEVAEATGLTVAKAIDDKDVRARGMGNLESLEVGEISMTKSRRRGTNAASLTLPDEAKQLLDGLTFMTIR